MGRRAGQPTARGTVRGHPVPKTVSQNCPNVQWTLLSFPSTISKKTHYNNGALCPKGMAPGEPDKMGIICFSCQCSFHGQRERAELHRRYLQCAGLYSPPCVG